jgi:RNA polymerase sigma-32 factor
MSQALRLPVSVPPISSLEAYVQAIQRVPLLSAEQEYALATRYRQNNDMDAARELVLAHLRLVVRVARGYKGYGLAEGDLIQEGNIGLMKAVKRFDPDMGVRLVSFAIHWIKAEIHEFILRNWRIVKIATTKAQRKLFFNLRSAVKRLGWMSDDETGELAKNLGVEKRDVAEMEKRLSSPDTSFDPLIDDDAEEHSSPSPAGYLADLRFEPVTHLAEEQIEERRASALQEALAALDARSRDIISQRWLSEAKTTLEDLAEKYGVSAERIRQIEKNAMAKLKAGMGDTAIFA